MTTPDIASLLKQDGLTYFMEAHNALSARIVEESGFEAIWASGLTISASLGLRDCNEASWSQVLDVLEHISDVTTVPILCDADTGYGNFNNARRFVRKLESRGIAGICIEDKRFPKMNSFVGEGQALAPIEEFVGKLNAMLDSRTTDLAIVARLEGLVSGVPLDEVIERATRYAATGVDALLVHSKQTDASEIFSFMTHWQGDIPVIIVPTTYPDTSTEAMLEAGVSGVIWANFTLRAAIAAMRDVCQRVREQGHVRDVLTEIANVSDILELTDTNELVEAEARYLPVDDAPTLRAVE